MLPNFIVIGAAKCGTTSLCDLLGEHREVFFSDPKEPHFFSNSPYMRSKRVAYEKLFHEAKTEVAVGEGSVSYTLPKVIKRSAEYIYKYIPECSIIYMVRNPVARIESDWKMRKFERRCPDTINEAVILQKNMIEISRYWENISIYLNLFRQEQILVVFLEDFSRDPYLELRRCFEHIGVDNSFRPKNAHVPRNDSKNFRSYGKLAKFLKKIYEDRLLKINMPNVIKNFAKEKLTKQERFIVKWDPKVLKFVKEQLSEDAKRFLHYFGKPDNFWDV